MPIVPPVLDDRSYEQLASELRRRIPVVTPEWTDHQPTDPGIALLELFAYLGEDLLFRFNQLPDTTLLAFLRLLQVPLRPPEPATGMVQLTPGTAAPVTGVLVPRRTVVRAGQVGFQTQQEMVALAVEAVGAVRAPAELPEDEELRGRAERAVQARGLAGDESPAFYTVAVLGADPSGTDAHPVDPGAAVDGLLWVALLRPERGPAALLDGAALSLGVLPDPLVVSRLDVAACPGASGTTTPGMVWRVTTPDFDGDRLRYLPVAVVADTSGGLTGPGVVTVRLPGGTGLPLLDDPALAGTGDLPPALDDERADRVVAWLQCGRPPGAAAPLPRLAWLGANAAQVVQEETASGELLGVGTGEPHQTYTLVHRGVVPGTLVLEVERAGRWEAWSPIDDLGASPAGTHYELDPEAGEVRFGDGIRGRAPQLGERVRVQSYRYGGGTAGNVGPQGISKVEPPAAADDPHLPFDPGLVSVTNPLATSGGAAGETLPEALDRIPGEIRRRDRAVTAGDFRELSLQVGGVGRAECLPRFHPKRPSVEAAGVVSVVVWPTADARRPSAPQPDRALLSRVCRHLDERRLVTTELYVLPPTYRPIAVAVGVHAKPGTGVEAARRWVEIVLRQYLAPLPPFGPEGGGWPLGRRVHGPELEAAVLQVDGVEYVDGLRLGEPDGDGGFDEVTTVLLEPWEVPELVAVTVVDGPPLAPGEAVEPPPPPATPVPIPVERATC